MSEFKFIPGAVEKLGDSQGIVDELGRIADKIAGLVEAPAKFKIATRKGRNHKGQAFAQVRMIGDGAVAVEFGSHNNEPLAPIRHALLSYGR